MRYSFIVIALLFNSFVFAQGDLENNILSWGDVLMQELDVNKAYNNEINNVVLKFCNDWFETDKLSSKIDLNMRPNQKKEICVALVNQSSSDLEIIANVVPWSLNDNWNIICSNNGNLVDWINVSNFEQFSGLIQLWAQKQLIKHFSLSTDVVSSGNYYACLTINTNVTEKLSESSPFNLVIRKAGNISINVSWSPYRFQWFNDIVSWIKKYTRQIAIVWIVVCGVLLVLSLLPSKKKIITKKSSNKK